MSSPRDHRPSDDESIEATAAAWLAQRDEALTSVEAAEFARWREADPRHEAAVLRLEHAWANLQQLRDFRPSAQRHPDPDLLAPPVRKKSLRHAVPLFALTATALVVVAIVLWPFRSGPHASTISAYSTTVGGYQRVMLTDGSVLELNGDTAAEVEFSASARRVHLARGEAHFTVSKNKARPFWVEAGGVSVRAVGTAFNVRLAAREIDVLVTEGKVELGSALSSVLGRALPPMTNPPATSPVSLVASERARIETISPLASGNRAASPVVEHVGPETIRELLAWQGPRLVFADTLLAEAVAQFNHRNTLQITLADTELSTLPVGGSFRAENVEAFVRLLESGGDVTVEHRDANHLVLHRTK